MEKHCEFCGKVIEAFSRNTRKYCNDNCKQLAFYSRQGKNWAQQLSFSKRESASPIVKSDFTLNDNEGNSEIVKRETKPSYMSPESPLLNAIVEYRKDGDIESMFTSLDFYWTPREIEIMHWVSERLRCLLENILRLSNYSYVDLHSVKQISTAFNDLTGSYYFKALPSEYPYFFLLIALRNEFATIVKECSGDKITLRLSVKRKAELIAAKYAIGNFVEGKKFSELKFANDQN